jgi:hypothetical protein
LEETRWSSVTQSTQLLGLYEKVLKEDVLPPINVREEGNEGGRKWTRQYEQP